MILDLFPHILLPESCRNSLNMIKIGFYKVFYMHHHIHKHLFLYLRQPIVMIYIISMLYKAAF